MKKSVLITGGAGFIGHNIALVLCKLGYSIRALDNLNPQIHGPNASWPKPLIGKCELIKGDVRNRKDWMSAIEGVELIIHLAAETGTGQSMYEIQRYTDVNIGGTALMLDILTNENHSIEKLVIASSRAIYGEGKYRCQEHGIVYPEHRQDTVMQKGDFECKCPECGGAVELLPTSEDSKIHPSSVYGITKYTQEQMVMTVGKAVGIPSVVFRYQNVYGPGQSLSNPYTGILSIFSTRIKNNSSINIFEDGKESRDFVYIEDVINATISALENDAANFNVFNIGSGIPTDILTVVKILCKSYEMDADIYISGNYRMGDIRHNYAELAKIKRLLGYSPTVNFETGLDRFVKWVNAQDCNHDNYELAIAEMRKKGLYK